jgi:hypothetical protein
MHEIYSTPQAIKRPWRQNERAGDCQITAPSNLTLLQLCKPPRWPTTPIVNRLLVLVNESLLLEVSLFVAFRSAKGWSFAERKTTLASC